MNERRLPKGEINDRRVAKRSVSPRRALKRPLSPRSVATSWRTVSGGSHLHDRALDLLLQKAERYGIRPKSGKITLLTSDCKPFAIDREVAYMFETLRNLEADDQEIVPLPAVDGTTLDKALEYCTFNRPSSRRSTADTRQFDEAYLDGIQNVDLLFRLLRCANYLDNPPMLRLLSKKVALMMVAEWPDLDDVRRAFEIQSAFTEDECSEVSKREPGVFRDLLHRAREIEARHFQKPFDEAKSGPLPTRGEMGRLALLEHFCLVMMERDRRYHSPRPAPGSRLASMFLQMPSRVCESIYEHFAHPPPHMLDATQHPRIARLYLDLEQAERAPSVGSRNMHQFTFSQNFRNAGPTRMYYHDDDPDSDEDWDAQDNGWINSDSRKCNEESCGEIIQDNEKARIVAEWTGHHGRDWRQNPMFERDLEVGESHDDAKHELCRMKGCGRCDIATNRCVSRNHDKKQVERQLRERIWAEYWKPRLFLSKMQAC